MCPPVPTSTQLRFARGWRDRGGSALAHACEGHQALAPVPCDIERQIAARAESAGARTAGMLVRVASAAWMAAMPRHGCNP
jgi:hypothetical protein